MPEIEIHLIVIYIYASNPESEVGMGLHKIKRQNRQPVPPVSSLIGSKLHPEIHSYRSVPPIDCISTNEASPPRSYAGQTRDYWVFVCDAASLHFKCDKL